MLAGLDEVQALIEWDGPVEKVGHWPIYVDFDDSLLDRRRLLASDAASTVPRSTGLLGRLRRRVRRLISPDDVTRRNVDAFISAVPRSAPNGSAPNGSAPNGSALNGLSHPGSTMPGSTVLVVGGGEIGLGAERLYEEPDVRVVAFDIYAGPHVQFLADAHRIPLAAGSVDGVVVQAVLEHVLDPARVVAEIHRVLRPDGLVYAETPFLQQVHEGAYDFTRYTESGHRWLFRRFDRVDSGVVSGPGTQLIWTLGALAEGLTRSRAAGKVARLMFCWLRVLDRFIPADRQIDGACGVYFLGGRSEQALSPADMPGAYQGAQR